MRTRRHPSRQDGDSPIVVLSNTVNNAWSLLMRKTSGQVSEISWRNWTGLGVPVLSHGQPSQARTVRLHAIEGCLDVGNPTDPNERLLKQAFQQATHLPKMMALMAHISIYQITRDKRIRHEKKCT